VNLRQVFEEENEVDDFVEAAFALDAPADLAAATETARADRKAGEVAFVEAGEGDLFGDHFAGTRGGLVEFGGVGALGDFDE
jgi:hypothetical protein